MDDDLLLVREVHGEVIKKKISYGNKRFSILDTRIKCILEDNRFFYLDRVSPEIVFFLKELNGETIGDEREGFIDILLSIPEVINILGKYVKRIVIDNFNNKSGTYSASVEFGDGTIVIKRKMIPSHAIFLAKLTRKPIYVRKQLVDQQEEIYSLLEEIDSETIDNDIEENSNL